MIDINEHDFKNQKIIADIGGTNARFGILNKDGSIQDLIVLKGKDFDSFVDAFQEYVRLCSCEHIKNAAVAIANPIDGDLIKMTNHNWNFSIESARQALGLDKLIFKNDFTALAMSIPFLDEIDLKQIGGSRYIKKSPIAVLGPGTGLGVSGLIYSGKDWIPLASEGGHVSLSPTTDREFEIFEACLNYYKHVSAERLISGSGIQFLYSVICELDGVEAIKDIKAADVTSKGLAQSDAQCIETLDIFTGLLGGVAGNVALSIGAKGGVYIGGGIIPKLGEYFYTSPFRERFEAKGRFKSYLKDIPVYVINAKYPALTGISQVFK